jgi:hypothetical protein
MPLSKKVTVAFAGEFAADTVAISEELPLSKFCSEAIETRVATALAGAAVTETLTGLDVLPA